MLGHVRQSVVNVEEVYCPQGTVIVADSSYRSGKGYTSLRYVWIPNTVKAIGVSAFRNSTTLTTVELEDGTRLEKLNVDSFNGCKSLENHDFEDAPLVTIAQNALRACSKITSFDFPETLEAIRYCAFYQTPLSGRVVIPKFSEEYKATLNLIICFYSFDSEGNVSFIQAKNDYSNDAIVGSSEFKTVTFKSVFDNKKPEAVALIPENNKDNFS